jgi:type VI secretion system protein ImpK
LTTPPPLRGLDDLVGCLKLAEATDLAQRGHYEQARTALSSCPTSPDTLDLLARIRAQEGRFGDAEELWRRAGAILGDEGAFQRQLARGRRDRASSPSSRLLGIGSRFAVLGALVSGLFLAGFAVGRRTR